VSSTREKRWEVNNEQRKYDKKKGVFYSSLLTFNFSLAFAYRELEYRNVIEGKTVPAMAMSGEQLIFIINRMLSEQERGIF